MPSLRIGARVCRLEYLCVQVGVTLPELRRKERVLVERLQLLRWRPLELLLQNMQGVFGIFDPRPDRRESQCVLGLFGIHRALHFSLFPFRTGAGPVRCAPLFFNTLHATIRTSRFPRSGLCTRACRWSGGSRCPRGGSILAGFQLGNHVLMRGIAKFLCRGVRRLACASFTLLAFLALHLGHRPAGHGDHASSWLGIRTACVPRLRRLLWIYSVSGRWLCGGIVLGIHVRVLSLLVCWFDRIAVIAE